MHDGDALRVLAARAHEALDTIAHADERCPAHVDHFDWCADVLDELARVAVRVGEAVAALGDQETAAGDDVRHHAQALATAIVRRRNESLTPLRSTG